MELGGLRQGLAQALALGLGLGTGLGSRPARTLAVPNSQRGHLVVVQPLFESGVQIVAALVEGGRPAVEARPAVEHRDAVVPLDL